MYQIIEKEFIHKCTGCGACENACPHDAIIFDLGYHTFEYPKIDGSKCIDCGLCAKVCPVNNYHVDNAMPHIFASRASDEIRKESSSGGMYSVFANKFISQGGVVYGTCMIDDYDVKYIRMSKVEDVSKCRGSKYVQSSVGKIYRSVKDDLIKDYPVIFFGCPCHIAGLKNFLNKDYPKLFTVDLICHGVPSQKIFFDYLQDKHPEKITGIHFRDKSLGWRADAIKIEYKDMPPYIRSRNSQDEYEVGFQENITLRDSCERCKFSTFPRSSDITIGDFWGCHNFIEDDGKGTSLVFINSKKGFELYSEIENELILSKPIDTTVDELKKYNRLFEFYAHSRQKWLFYEHLKTKKYSQAINYAKKDIYDAGIVGIPTVENFGGSLTYVALYYILRDMGLTCFFVERPTSAPHPPAPLEKSYYESPFEPETIIFDKMPDTESMHELNKKADCFIVGSDQLFHHNLYNNFAHFANLSWVDDNKKKIAYAASFGHDEFTGDELERAEMSYYMQKFDAFSVRESSGVKLAKECFGVESTQVLDPVFLCPPSVYQNIAGKAKFNDDGKYIAAYILDPDINKENIIQEISKELSLPYHIYTEMFYDNVSVKNKWSLDIETGKIEDRLSCLLNSEIIVTDSFHGMCFAIIFHKNFIAIKNTGRGAARFESIINILGLENRLISVDDNEYKSILHEEVDYSSVLKKLKPEIQKSKSWLKHSLVRKLKPLSDRDIYMQDIRQKNKENTILFSKLLKYIGLSYVSETNILKYIDQIKKSLDRSLIAISAKDTPGMAYTSELCDKLRSLGLKSDFMHAHWCGYIAVLYRGVVIHEAIRYEEHIKFDMVKDNIRLSVESAPLHKGNRASIQINGVEYAVNGRGLNIVVFDMDKSYVTDSVAFDTHMPKFACTRNQNV